MLMSICLSFLMAQLQATPTDNIKFSRPFEDSRFNYSWISSKYGYREINKGGVLTSEFHSGIDYRLPQGTKIVAMYKGTIRFAGWGGSYGLLVIVDHGVINGKRVETWYAHLHEITYDTRIVLQGDEIAKSGATGNAEGAHIHLEVRANGRPVHPGLYIVPERFKND